MARSVLISEEMKAFIVTRYAMYEKTREIKSALQESFGVDIDPDRIRKYDGDSNDCRCGKKYLAIFAETRKDFLEEVRLQHPVSQRAFRIKRLGEMADRAFENKNFVLAANLMKQAAMETGGSFTNELNVKGKVNHNHQGTIDTRSPEEKRNLLADIVADALSRMPTASVN